MRIEVEIQDGINPTTALERVKQVIAGGKVSRDRKGKSYYRWATSFLTYEGLVMVHTRNYRKNNCFLVYSENRHEQKEKTGK